MGLLNKLTGWKQRKTTKDHRVIRESVSKSLRNCRFETMEQRQVLSADPIFVGSVYIEDDSGTDSQADTFYVSFEGGSDTTEMTQIVIDGNQDGDASQLSSPDVYFDITPGSGLGSGGGHGFAFDDRSVGIEAGDIKSVKVLDGGTRLEIDIDNFEAGDVFVFGIDVDQFFEGKPDDQVTSGIEFAGSSLEARFEDPHYSFNPDPSVAEGIYGYNFDFGSDDATNTGILTGLPTEDNRQNESGLDSNENRTAGVMMQYDLNPRPISICGTVFHDRNINLTQDAGEEGIEGVELALQVKDADGNWIDAGENGSRLTTLTDENGDYCFGEVLGLLPGTFRVLEVQPADYPFSTGAIPGTVSGTDSGSTNDVNVLSEIEIPLGGMHAIDYDFGEVRAAKLSGFVYQDRNFSEAMDAGDQGIEGVEMMLTGVDRFGNDVSLTTTTDEDGYYCFDMLAPGTYQVMEVQPAEFEDFADNVGNVGGTTIGDVPQNDKIGNIVLESEDVGVQYNFGEVKYSSLSGHVKITTPDGRCVSAEHPDYSGIGGVTIRLLDENGNQFETTTDSNGFYKFDGLRPGSYSIVEVQPDGYFDGNEQVGTIDGVTVGTHSTNDEFTSILLTDGQDGVNYDFCENAPATLSGHVKAVEGDGTPKTPIEGVTITLTNAEGQTWETTTDSDGFYEFTGLPPGTYQVVETQPDGYYDGDDSRGTVDGVTTGVRTNDQFSQVVLGSGSQALDYDFCEEVPGTVSGHVWSLSANGDKTAIGNVVITLMDQDGNTWETATNDNGFYKFEDLAPGTYTLIETQPDGYFDGDESAGSLGGDIFANDRVDNIVLTSGRSGVNYDFCEYEPASVSGHVAAITNADGSKTPIEGVEISLIDSDGNSVVTTTDSDGYYEFIGLPPGEYTIVETQPDGYFDGPDSLGTVGAQSIGTAKNDRFEKVVLGSGQQGVNYDFCEHLPASVSGHVLALTGSDGTKTPIEGVEITLIDEDGNEVVTTTDEDGFYEFTGLEPGNYTIVETQPEGYYDGPDSLGTVEGESVGVRTNDRFNNVVLGSGQEGVNYDFCENIAAEIHGTVYHDRNDNGIQDAGEEGIANTTVQLLDLAGNVIQQVETMENGEYWFLNVAPGEYCIKEVQPGGWLDGQDTAGMINDVEVGSATNDKINGIVIGAGEVGIEYNFGELKAGSIEGFVHTDVNGNCVHDDIAGERALANVTLQLRDSQGRIITTTKTDADGYYKFDGLEPGEYTVSQVQPKSVFDLDQVVGVDAETGEAGTGTVLDNAIGQITVSSGQALQHYNFCETPPAKLSGYVYQDGSTINLGADEDLPTPDELSQIRDGLRTLDDTPLEGVTLELRDGVTGLAILDDDGQPIRTKTDADGYYCFDHLKPGNYAVFQVQPDGYLDSLDLAGTTDGIPVNPSDGIDEATVLSTLDDSVDAGTDAILRILVAANEHSQLNNFSEVLVSTPEPEPEPRDRDFPDPRPPVIPRTPNIGRGFVPYSLLGMAGSQGVQQSTFTGIGVIADQPLAPVGDYVWQLSVINEGFPRGEDINAKDGITWKSASHMTTNNWNSIGMETGRWLFTTEDVTEISSKVKTEQYFFGKDEAFPITGDFNGDGIDELGFFDAGQWFIDVSGNKSWGADDMWARLGQAGDHPLVGDWDGDGKDDIGVYGQHRYDLEDLRNEPGIPDPENFADTNPKNIPPTSKQRPNFDRDLQRDEKGNQRTDVVDHVFKYGSAEDYPLVGDWNGDGIRTIGVFRDGIWTLDADGNGRISDADITAKFGRSGDIPVVGDFNGDGVEEIGVFRDGKWIIDINGDREMDAHDTVFALGEAGDQPVVGDFDGDGVDEVGVYQQGVSQNVEGQINIDLN